MARFTQYIGLSPAAEHYLTTHEHREIGQWIMTFGIGYEPVHGTIYEVQVGKDQCGISGVNTYAEIEDVTPWSGGPVIHTCLRNLATGEKCFTWKDDEIQC